MRLSEYIGLIVTSALEAVDVEDKAARRALTVHLPEVLGELLSGGEHQDQLILMNAVVGRTLERSLETSTDVMVDPLVLTEALEWAFESCGVPGELEDDEPAAAAQAPAESPAPPGPPTAADTPVTSTPANEADLTAVTHCLRQSLCNCWLYQVIDPDKFVSILGGLLPDMVDGDLLDLAPLWDILVTVPGVDEERVTEFFLVVERGGLPIEYALPDEVALLSDEERETALRSAEEGALSEAEQEVGVEPGPASKAAGDAAPPESVRSPSAPPDPGGSPKGSGPRPSAPPRGGTSRPTPASGVRPAHQRKPSKGPNKATRPKDRFDGDVARETWTQAKRWGPWALLAVLLVVGGLFLLKRGSSPKPAGRPFPTAAYYKVMPLERALRKNQTLHVFLREDWPHTGSRAVGERTYYLGKALRRAGIRTIHVYNSFGRHVYTHKVQTSGGRVIGGW